MSILIKDMQMPVRENSYLEIVIHPDGTVFSGGGSYLGRLAVELPPHGDLIDRDALKAEHVEAERGRYGGLFVVGDNRFMKRFVDAPIFVPAEGGTT